MTLIFYPISGGKLGSMVKNLPILLLTTTGRKTGIVRTVPLGYFMDGKAYVLTASNGGSDSHPSWYLNLTGNPDTTIEVGSQKIKVSASVVPQEQRTSLWETLLSKAPGYKQYENSTLRQIPLVRLTPR